MVELEGQAFLKALGKILVCDVSVLNYTYPTFVTPENFVALVQLKGVKAVYSQDKQDVVVNMFKKVDYQLFWFNDDGVPTATKVKNL